MAVVCDVCGRGKGKPMYGVIYASVDPGEMHVHFQLMQEMSYSIDVSGMICITCLDKLHIREMAAKVSADIERYERQKEARKLIDVTPKALGAGRARLLPAGGGE